jgi:hypothetical protein
VSGLAVALLILSLMGLVTSFTTHGFIRVLLVIVDGVGWLSPNEQGEIREAG